jgi:hypothetical protein
MNILYIIIPLVAISLAALLIIRPKLLVLNKSHTRYLKPGEITGKHVSPKIRKINGSMVIHPPIVEDKNLKQHPVFQTQAQNNQFKLFIEKK